VCGARAGASTGSGRKTRRSAACVSGVFELCESARAVVNGRFEPIEGGAGEPAGGEEDEAGDARRARRKLSVCNDLF